MKKLFVIPLFLIGWICSATTYYVSPTGSDSNSGTITSPWFNLNKAWTVVVAGDIVYMRGGTYSYTSQQSLTGKNGASGNLIKVWAYPGESPIITRASSWSSGGYKAGVFFVGNYVHFKGIKITGFDQRDTYVWSAMRCEDFNYNIFEQIDFSRNGLGAYMTSMNGSCTGNLFLNCDWHDNYDPLTNYENADGINFENVKAGGTNTFRGCRAWNNSDDGFDFYGNDSYLLIDNCWAWGQGFKEDQATIGGDGSGFKMGGANGSLSSVLARIQNCVAFGNAAWGYNENASPHNMEVYNNTSFGNNVTKSWGGGFHFNKPGVAYTLKNNLSYDDGTPDDLGSLTNVNHNSWDIGTSVTSASFISVKSTGMEGPRQADGSLPVLTFLNLAKGSTLVDAGINVGLPYAGNAPDLGAYESQGTSVAVNPVYSGSTIENAAPSVIGMNYNLTLANTLPPATAFVVMVNSTARGVNTVAISATKVLLTLASPIVKGDVITVAYTIPATNPLQSTSGGRAATLSAQTVTNNVIGAVTLPVYVSSVIQNATPANLEITYSLSQANIVPAATAFKVLVNNASRTVNTVAVSGTKVTLTLASPVIFGNVVTVAYTKPATNPLQTTTGAQVESFSAQSVVNGVIAVTNTTVATVKMTVTPNPVHKIVNVGLDYTGSTSAQIAALSPQIIRIYNSYGRLYIEKSLVTGVTSFQIPINLRSGVYNVQMLSAGVVKASQKIIVYR